MKIQINSSNEIVAYVVVGDLNNGIEIDDTPAGFVEGFKPKKYKYTNDKIVLNETYEYNEETPITPLPAHISGSDDELRKTYGNLQMSSVQTAKIVSDLSKQVALLTKQNVELQNQLNNKGVE
ncbi:hypothetical protein BUZ00_03245 [Staphylococcus gallinarum]|uniref:DUF2977 domain-containing protein n=1 Tax=Staphylococcus gallinarum TaxID=1293 RepID=UPI000D1C62B3|nr:DUF2977 domain-containing protein [Staphylococcus gallinarum]PTE37253.1 hypothetical protein BUZ00_03245 [Staphylococcus gallinarum]